MTRWGKTGTADELPEPEPEALLTDEEVAVAAGYFTGMKRALNSGATFRSALSLHTVTMILALVQRVEALEARLAEREGDGK